MNGPACSVRRTLQNPTILDWPLAGVTHVTITDPRHCLLGKRLAILSDRSGRGPAYLVVALPDGRKRSIRIASTDLATPAVPESGTGAGISRISVRTLIPLAQHLSANLALLAEEVIRDGHPSASASRCVSATIDASRHNPPASASASAPVAEPAGSDAAADRPHGRGADEADRAGAPRKRKGDRLC
jgi:hypothetical protein